MNYCQFKYNLDKISECFYVENILIYENDTIIAYIYPFCYNHYVEYTIIKGGLKMIKSKDSLIVSLLNRGNKYRLKCENCNSVSVQITEHSEPDYTCLDCGGRCNIFKEFLADKEDIIFSMMGIRD